MALGDNNIKRFDGNVDMISGVWNTVAIDARAIEQYLNGALLFVVSLQFISYNYIL